MKLYGFLALIITIVVVIVGSFLGGVFYERNSQAVTTVNSITIRNRIENEAFIITKTLYINQEATIKVDQGSDWSNFWWGQTITAKSLMKVNVGVDFKKIKESDITINNVSKTITIKLPSAEVLDVSLGGDITVNSQTGILKLIFDNNTNSDYNKALNQLKLDATAAANADTQMLTDAKADSIKLIQLVLKDTGYTVTFQ